MITITTNFLCLITNIVFAIDDNESNLDYTTNTIQIAKFNLLKNVNITLPKLDINQALIQHTFAGLNMMDHQYLKGSYNIKLPSLMGIEGVGKIIALGSQVKDWAVGDRIGYCTAPIGSYSQKRIIDVDYLIKLPDDIDDQIACAILMRGIVSHMLADRVFKIKENSLVMVNGAAGGIGHILTQYLRNIHGVVVVGTVGNEKKIPFTKEHGCHVSYNYNIESSKKEIKNFSENRGIFVIFDGVGLKTFNMSLDLLSCFGMLINFGQVSGCISTIPPEKLSAKSLFITRPSMYHYKANRLELILTAEKIFELFKKGVIKPHINKIYSFNISDIQKAHHDLSSGMLYGVSLIKF